eukprot:TRINITY_DN2136_c0_g1_i2.p1 TRINITY_DN2136_c0_g1~~TRINITY_DN2136_c0_g1_i2.p1  ORF type:complete len:488 (-),score=102.45 TRINITY_DN2136_c0_g1_i2:758-2221(-)
MAEEVPENVKSYVLGFYQSLKERNISQINYNYDTNWNKMCDKYFKQTEWPTADKISSIVNNDPLFLFLYNERYYRHLYSKLRKQLTLKQRIAAWNSYSKFLDHILQAQKPVELELPIQWVWDIVDEFVYQYQGFCQLRSKLKESADTSAEELNLLKSNPKVWNTATVFRYLHQLINKSDIVQILQAEREGKQFDYSKNPFSKSQFYQNMGYFSILSLSRLHCILCDYHMTLKVLDPIDLHKKKARYTKVTDAYVTLYYYTGFAYMMVRRYQDALKTFTSILLYISRMKQFTDQKKTDKMYALLEILLKFCPKRIDEHINTILHSEHINKQQSREVDKLFVYACPKFVFPTLSDADELTSTSPLPLQEKLFMKEVNQQAHLPTIRSYLKLYTTIDLEKLYNLLEKKVDKETLRNYLIQFVHKTRQIQWSTGNKPIEGSLASSAYLEFYIEKEMIHILDNTVKRRYGEMFLRNCQKLEEIAADLEKRDN